MRTFLLSFSFLGLCLNASAQTLGNNSVSSAQPIVPANTAITVTVKDHVALREGAPVVGIVESAIYVDQHLAIPAGSRVMGSVEKLTPVAHKERVKALMNGDLTPLKKPTVVFNRLVLRDGRTFAITTNGAAPGSTLLRLSSSPAQHGGFIHGLINDARSSFQSEVHRTLDSVRAPAKSERLRQAFYSMLPYHPQSISSGSGLTFHLASPLELPQAGVQPLLKTNHLGEKPAAGSVLHARLTSTLDSAELKKGDPVEAVVTQPLVDGSNELIIPAGSTLKGVVMRAKAAKRFGRMGELRFAFREIDLPGGMQTRTQMELSRANVTDGSLQIDDEGGSKAVDRPTKYIGPLMMVALSSSVNEDDNGFATTSGATGGLGLIGRILALSTGSHGISYGFAYYGAARSTYSHFIARGHDVRFPADTEIELTLGR